ncbi:hypothetical protein [Novosphingobium sp. fls2-241-R2A-195]|uniref:hypothetical protein n=1 Tax=Novosphingobium sp. fls2-241-R2A-195 TaxID=3040296 RepID=UPI00254C1B89|nr:hypothetical protein [Novosphingobium sp. fls2-241-R2A-195]
MQENNVHHMDFGSRVASRMVDSASHSGDLKGGDGGGTSGGMSEEALKPRVDFLHTAFLWLAGLMVTAFLALITVNLTLAGNANTRTDKLVETVSGLNRQAGEVASNQDEANRRLDRIEAKIDRLLEKK